MTRLLQTVSMVAIMAVSGPPSSAQDNLAAAKRLQSDWRQCVDLSAALAPTRSDDFLGPAELAFRSCATEETLFLAFVNGVAPTKVAADTMIVAHYRDRLALKKANNR